MADWTNLPNERFEPGAPARGIDARRLRDNPIAIAEGAAGAPRIAGQQGPAVRAAGLFSGSAERDWVLARTAAASVGAVGTYAVAWNTTSNDVSRGSAVSGSSLRVATGRAAMSNVTNSVDSFPTDNTVALSGAWRLVSGGRGRISSAGTFTWYAAFWLRIS